MRWSKVLWEAILVAVIGAVVAFTANALSPKGLNLSLPLPVQSTPNTGNTNAAAASPEELTLARLRQDGLQVMNEVEALEAFRDPRREQGSIIFIDARKDEDYQSGHIPGAYQLDYYYYQRYLAAILTPCQTAEKIIVYCHGGACTDSEQTALLLRDSIHIPGAKLFVYTGGMTEWTNDKRPIETGDRNSGQISTAGK